jgi:hypothetical protein
VKADRQEHCTSSDEKEDQRDQEGWRFPKTSIGWLTTWQVLRALGGLDATPLPTKTSRVQRPLRHSTTRTSISPKHTVKPSGFLAHIKALALLHQKNQQISARWRNCGILTDTKLLNFGRHYLENRLSVAGLAT